MTCFLFIFLKVYPLTNGYKVQISRGKNKDRSGFHLMRSYSQLNHRVCRYLYTLNIQILGFRTILMKVNSEKRFTRIWFMMCYFHCFFICQQFCLKWKRNVYYDIGMNLKRNCLKSQWVYCYLLLWRRLKNISKCLWEIT